MNSESRGLRTSDVTPGGKLRVLPPRAWKTQVHLSDVSKETFPFDLVIRATPFTPYRCFSRQFSNPMGRGQMALTMKGNGDAT